METMLSKVKRLECRLNEIYPHLNWVRKSIEVDGEKLRCTYTLREKRSKMQIITIEFIGNNSYRIFCGGSKWLGKKLQMKRLRHF